MEVKNQRVAQATRMKMNAIFLGMSVVMLAVMAVSMWKDTHPEWRAYQEKYVVLERKLLLARKADLERQIQHPDPLADYKKAQKQYNDAKAAFDTASSALDGTEADLEEMEIQSKAGDTEEGGAQAVTAASVTTTKAVPAKATNAEMAELDKEFKNDQAAKSPSDSDQTENANASGASGANAPAQKQPSKDELAELDKEFKDSTPAAQGTSETPKPASSGTASKEGSKPSKDEMAELDKEFQSSSAPKATANAEETAGTAGKASAAKTPSYDEASFTIDTKGADDRLEAAKRNFLAEQQRHTKEMIALPKDEALKRKLADTYLKEAKQTLDLAQADVALQSGKGVVKQAALVAEWWQDASLLKSGTAHAPDQVQKLQESQKKLQDHIGALNRELRLLNDRIERNRTGGQEVQQVFVSQLGAVDRCETCHKGSEDPMFAGAPEPFRTHPGNMLKWHPVDRFGCTSCHAGFGSALDHGEAHGELVGKGRPLLVGEQVQASCGKCHGESDQVPGASTFLAGAQLFRNSGCLGCHKVETIPTPQKAGPSLDRINEKVSATWLVAWLKNPRSHSLEARMPNFGLTQPEALSIAAYLMSQHGQPQLDELPPVPPTTPEKLAAGKRLVTSLGCLGCHSISGEGNTVGPELTNVRSKVRPEWLYSWIENPKAYLPNSRMPVFGLTKEQCVLIGNYLLSVGAQRELPVFSKDVFGTAAAKKGGDLIGQRGCAGCHDIKGFDRIAAPELSRVGDKTADILDFGSFKAPKKVLYEWLVNKVKKPNSYDTSQFKAKMPEFGLDDQEARSIAVFLLSLTSDNVPPEYRRGVRDQDSPLVAGRRIFADHNCAGCHTLLGQGGKIGPNLTREGEKVKPSWLFPFLEHPERIRWWQDARMPNFHLSTAEATTLTEYLMELSNQPAPYDYTPPERLVFPLSEEGGKHFIDLKCQSCHPIGGKQQVAGGDTKKLGPDLAMSPRRLKADWMFRFLKSPQAFDPGTQMPTFKQSDHVFQSIVDFLMKQRTP